MTDEQLSALLRLKRHEQPPPQYFDRLLEEIHRRQRSELLRRPLWKIALERVQTFLSAHSMGQVSYAGSFAALLAIGMVAVGILTPTGKVELAANVPPPLISAAPDRLLSLQAPTHLPALGSPSFQVAPADYEPVVRQPRYVIDARPVSYEPSSSFDF